MINFKKSTLLLGVLVLLTQTATTADVVTATEKKIVVKQDEKLVQVNTIESNNRMYIATSDIENLLSVTFVETDIKNVYRVVELNEEVDENNVTEEQSDKKDIFVGYKNKKDEYTIGTLYYADGRVYSGAFKNGIPHGDGTLLQLDGSVYIGTFDSGYPHGSGKIHYKDGSYYKGEIRYGTLTGLGRMQYANKDVYKGYFYLGLYHGVGAFSDYDGGTRQGLWEYGDYKRYMKQEDMDEFEFTM